MITVKSLSGAAEFNTGDRIKVIAGKYAGRKGVYHKHCSVVFKDHCRVKLDLKPREREQKIVMVQKIEISHE